MGTSRTGKLSTLQERTGMMFSEASEAESQAIGQAKIGYGEAQKILKQASRKISDNDLFPVLGEVLMPSGTAKDHYYFSG